MNAIRRGRPLLAVLLAAVIAAPMIASAQSPDAARDEQHAPHKAKQALDDRVDPRMPADNVGRGTHFARKPLGEGVYFNDANRQAVRKYYAALAARHCPAGAAAPAHGCPPAPAKQPWRIGQPLPATAVVQPVPKAIRQSLPKVPPGLSYVQVAGDILLVANGSKMVVDGIDGVAVR